MHLLRTVPPRQLENICTEYNICIRDAFSKITGIFPSEANFIQFSRSVGRGGLGFRNPIFFSHIAYLASSINASTRDQTSLGDIDDIQSAINYVNEYVLSDNDIPYNIDSEFRIPKGKNENPSGRPKKHFIDIPSQHDLSCKLEDKQLKCAVNSALLAQNSALAAQLRSMSSKHAGAWMRVVPSKTLFLNFKPSEYIILLRWWMRLPQFAADEIHRCTKCEAVLDPLGYHALTCKSGGDLIHRHNAIRDMVFKACQTAGLTPRLEKHGLIAIPTIAQQMYTSHTLIMVNHVQQTSPLPTPCNQTKYFMRQGNQQALPRGTLSW